MDKTVPERALRFRAPALGARLDDEPFAAAPILRRQDGRRGCRRNRHAGDAVEGACAEAPRQAKAPATRTAEITETPGASDRAFVVSGGANRQKRRIINVTEQNSPPAAASSKPDTPKGASAVCSIAVDAITVPSERLRKLRPEVVDWLVESITARSLLEPIIVRRRGAGYELIAGHHRFEAARNCGHQTIRAEVYDSLSDDEAELIQIDENLIRANLSDAERILHVARRKELYEKLHPETKHGGDRRSAGARSSSQNENLKAFVADIAVKTGKGRSTVARDVTRAKKVAVLDDIAGNCLDKGDEIDALGKLPEGEQRKLATAAKAGEKVSAKARKPRQKPPERSAACPPSTVGPTRPATLINPGIGQLRGTRDMPAQPRAALQRTTERATTPNGTSASWFGSSGPAEYKVAARMIAPESGLPSDRHADRIESAVVLEAVKVWPGRGGACCKVGATANLDSSCARRRERSARGNGPDRTKKLKKESR